MKPDNFVKVISTIGKTKLPNDVMDIAKTLFHTDDMPAHEAITAAYKLAGKPIPGVHQIAIDILKKGENPNVNFWKAKVPLPDTVDPTGIRTMRRKGVDELIDRGYQEIPQLESQLGYTLNLLRTNPFTEAGEPIVSKDSAVYLANRLKYENNNSKFYNVLKALGLDW